MGTMYVPDSIPEEDREVMTGSGRHGQSLDLGGDLGVLVVDMSREFVSEEYSAGNAEAGRPTVEAIARLLDRTRELGFPEFYTRPLTGDHPYERGVWGETLSLPDPDEADDGRKEFVEEISPTEDSVVVNKYKPSAFFGTQLAGMLHYAGVEDLVVAGMSTSGCIRATVVDAFSHNYRVVIPEECVGARSGISDEVELFDMDMKYADVLPLDELLAELDS